MLAEVRADNIASGIGRKTKILGVRCVASVICSFYAPIKAQSSAVFGGIALPLKGVEGLE